MGSANKKVVTTNRHVYEMLAPAAHVEVMKAINWASSDFQEAVGRRVQYDDDLMIEGDEEHIRVYFEVPGV
ncbi:MAG: hypothetical protein ACXVHX_39125 [Solirubrobacteraceae bacterium]